MPEEDLQAAARELLGAALRTLCGSAPLDTRGAEQTARRRAAQRVPLGPLMNAFRLGFTAIWERLLEHASAAGPDEQLALLRGAESLWAVIDDCSRAVTEADEQARTELAQVDAQRRLDALNALLEGRTANWLRLAAGPATVGLPPGADHVALAAEQDPDPGDVDPARLLRDQGLSCALRPGSGLWLGVVALPARWSVQQLVERLTPTWSGRAGVSEPYADLADTAVAVQDAAAALRCLPAGTTGLARSADDPLAVLLTHSPALAASAATAFLGAAAAADELLWGRWRPTSPAEASPRRRSCCSSTATRSGVGCARSRS